MATTPRKDLPGTNAPNWSQRVTEELRVLMGRGGNGRALTAKDLIDSGIAKPGAGGGLVPGVPGGGDTEPDLTPPPMPTGFAVTAGLTTVFVEHDAPGYTQGHGHDRTVVYGVLQTGSTAPTFDQAVVLFQFQGTIGAYPAALGTRYRLWIKWQSQDGVQSVSPAGGINGLDVQTGKIGNNDLGPLIVEAGNLANGAVSASKFASGIEPVSIVTGESLPTVKSTSNITFKGQLYTWSETAGKYELPEFNGSIGGANLVKNAALLSADAWGVYANGATVSPTLELLPGRYPNRKWAKVVAQSPCESLGLWQNPLPYVQVFRAHQEYTVSVRVKSANLAILQFAWNFWPTKLYRYNTAEAIGPDERVISLTFAYSQDTAAQLYVSGFHASIFPMPVGSEIWLTEPQLEEGDTSTAWAPNPIDLPPGSIHGVQIADDSITAPKLVAGSVVAGKLAANAVSAENLQVGAVVAGKLAADAVTAGAVAAGAITAEKLAVGAIAAGSAAIQNGAIGNAMIGDAAIDNAKIVNVSASKITAGYMQVGSYIASTNYAPGASGFVSYASGNAEYNNITMRGTVYANSGVIGGININANGLNAGGFSGYAWPASGGGFHLGPNGLLLGNLNTGQYVQMTSSGGLYAPGLTINGGNATFGGNLSAASGTFYGSGSFSGTLSASTLTTVGGRFTAYSDGSVVADRVDIRRREAMATGSVYWGASSTTSDPISLWGPDGALIYIDTGIDFAAATDFSVNQPLHAVAEVYSSVSQGGVSNGTRLFEVMCSATPFISASHYPGVFDWPYTHATSQLSPRIYIAVRARIVNQQPSLWQVTLGSVRWSLFKS